MCLEKKNVINWFHGIFKYCMIQRLTPPSAVSNQSEQKLTEQNLFIIKGLFGLVRGARHY